MNEFCSSSLPLTTAQRGLWVGQKIGSKHVTVNVAEAVELFGPIQPPLFQQALRQLTCEFETLRIQVVEHQGVPRQVIAPAHSGDFPYMDFREYPDPLEAARQWMMAEVIKPIDLAIDTLWFGALFRLGEAHYLWYHRAHHIVLDGYTGGMVAQRLAEIYSAYVRGEEPTPSEVNPLANLVELEAHYRQSERYQRDRAYWIAQMQNVPEAITLSRHKAVAMGGLMRSTGYLSPADTERLREHGRQCSASLPQMLIALVAAYYHRVTGATDLVMGMPVTGRINGQFRRTPGMVANAVPIRLAMDANAPISALFGQTAQVVKQALRHQQFRYEDLRRELGLVNLGQQLAWLGVNIEPFDYSHDFGGASARAHNLSNGSGEDLTVFVYDRGNEAGLRFDLDANPSLYGTAELDEHCQRLLRLVAAVVDDPQQALGAIDILGAPERQRLLQDWNDTAGPLPELPLPAWFERQAHTTPDAPAVVYGDRTLTYRQLRQQATLLAQQWIDDGLLPGDIVAVAMPRSEQLLTVMLAVLWIGASYLPLDPYAPMERTRLMIDDASPIALVTERAWREKFERGGMLWLDPQPRPEPMPKLPPLAQLDGRAYVLYTSGSTGRPKAVEIDHRNLSNFLLGMQHQLRPSASDRFLALTTVSFDIAALELFLPLTVGACVVIADSEVSRDPPALARLIHRQAISVMQATPSLWKVLLAANDAPLSQLHALVGGEALGADLAARLLARTARLTQLYGPTETTVWSTAIELSQADIAAPPIGRPILNTRVYVLDEQCQLLPTGATGELYIGGAGVAKGYLNRAQLTEARFLPDPFDREGGRMYRTGDLARWRDDGVLEFLGRVDQQVKIRGHRVEPGEIEALLIAHSALAEAVVIGQCDDEGTTSLVAYVVARPQRQPSPEELRDYLTGRLPEYMIPSVFMLLPAMPLNVNGKLDRKALPAPQRAASRGYVAARTPIEQQLVQLWQDLLGIERIGIHDNFFELGGDSLRAAEMLARFPQQFGVELPLGKLFEASTIAGLAACLQRLDHATDPLGTILPLRAEGRDAPLFCIHPIVGLGWSFANLLRHLPAEVPVYALQSPGLRSSGAPSSIEAIAADYLAQIQRIQPSGPYRLLGWSLGGLIAHAMAAQLRAQGESVQLLAMLDAYPFVTEHAGARDETAQALVALHMLGIETPPQGPPTSIAALAELICHSYDLFSLPLVQQLLKDDPALIERIGALTQHHLNLARSYQPPQLDANMLFLQAAQRNVTNLDDLLHYHAQAWQRFVSGRIELQSIDATHQSMLDPLPAAQIGRLLQRHLSPMPAPAALQNVPQAIAHA
jgi:enterobactin synthetase component F